MFVPSLLAISVRILLSAEAGPKVKYIERYGFFLIYNIYLCLDVFVLSLMMTNSNTSA